jgi:hypothetical protein
MRSFGGWWGGSRHLVLLKTAHLSGENSQQVPFDFAQGRLSTPQITALAVICCGRNDRVGECVSH